MSQIPFLKHNWSNIISISGLKLLKRNDIILYTESPSEKTTIDPSKLSNDFLCYRVTANNIEDNTLFIWNYPVNEVSMKNMTQGHFSISYNEILNNNKWLI